MGESSIVFGRISTFGEKEMEHNIKIVSELPSEKDQFSFFTNEMFNRNTIKGKQNYTFGFATSYKNIEHRWQNWIEEFEDLISKLKWESINVILETEMFGTHQYFWLKKFYRDNKEQPRKNDFGLIEKNNWYFGKGHRNFWGMKNKFGWENEIEEIRTFKELVQILDKTINEKNSSILNKIDESKLRINTNKNSFKHILSALIKLYLNEAEKQTDLISKSNFKENQIFGSESNLNITSIKLEEGESETTWVNHFVDKMIDIKREKNDT